MESISRREWLWVIQISMHQGTKLPRLGPHGQGFTLELWALLLPSFTKRSLRAVHMAKTKVKKHQPGRGGGQGGTKNLSGFSALVLLQKNITVMQFHLNREVGGGWTAFVHLLAGSCVLACDYVSYSVTCIDSPVGVFVHQELLNFFMYIILNHVLSIIIRYIQILYIYIQILSDHWVQIFYCDSAVSARMRPWTQMKLDEACPIFHSQGFDAGRQESRAQKRLTPRLPAEIQLAVTLRWLFVSDGH